MMLETDRSITELPGADRLAQLIIKALPEMDFGNRSPYPYWIFIRGSEDLELGVENTELPKGYRHVSGVAYQFPCLRVYAEQGTLDGVIVKGNTHKSLESDRHRTIVKMIPSTNELPRKCVGLGAAYYEALLVIEYTSKSTNEAGTSTQ
jgi:hypothetical protein